MDDADGLAAPAPGSPASPAGSPTVGPAADPTADPGSVQLPAAPASSAAPAPPRPPNASRSGRAARSQARRASRVIRCARRGPRVTAGWLQEPPAMVARRPPRRGRGREVVLALAVPCVLALIVGILASSIQLVAADAEEYPEYRRPSQSSGAVAPPKLSGPDSQSEDEFVEAMLRGVGVEGSPGESKDLQAERERWFQAREEAKLQRQLQAEREELLKEERADLQKPLAASPPQRDPAELSQRWQQAAKAALAQQQQQQQQQATKEGAKQAAEKAAKEAAEKAAKEAAEKASKEAAAKAAKEAAERNAKEAASKAAKEAAEQAAKEAAKEAAEKNAKEAAEKMAREAVEQAAKQAAEQEAQRAAEAALARQQQQQQQQQQQLQLAEQGMTPERQQEQLLGGRTASLAQVMEALQQLSRADGEDALYNDADLTDLTRALKQKPQVPELDAALVRTMLTQEGAAERALPALPRTWRQVLSSLAQPESGNGANLYNLMDLLTASSWMAQMQRNAQQQQHHQDQYQQQLIDQQNEHLSKDARGRVLRPPPYTYNFEVPKSSSPFAVGPAEPKFYQGDVRLPGLLSPPQDQDEAEEGAGAARGASSTDDLADADEDLGAADGEDLSPFLTDPESSALQAQRQRMQMLLDAERAMQRQRLAVTPPLGLELTQGRHQAKPTVTRDSKVDDDRGSNLSSHDNPVVKKQLTFPKDHWFFGMDDVGKLAIFIGCSIAVSSLILGFIVWQYRLHRNAKAAADVEYPAYGVTGPNKDISPTGTGGDRRLAQSAQMYHYQHQKQQILAMESRAAGGRRGSMSEAESEDENEEGDYTVYECPGLAPTQEMEVKNPLFQDDPTPATPAPGEAGQDVDGVADGGSGGGAAGRKKGSVDSGKPAADSKPSNAKQSTGNSGGSNSSRRP